MTTNSLIRIGQYADLARHSLRLRMSSDETIRDRSRQLIAQRMGKLRGLPQKLGQIMSFASSSSDDFVNNYFTDLCDQADPLPIESILPLLESAWKRQVDDVFTDIDPVGRAASIGQVHRATLRDGRDVAIKVQYPGIREAIHTDLKMLGWLSLPVGNLNRGFELAEYKKRILAGLEEELDYQREAKRQEEFRRWTQAKGFVVVPRVVNDLSNSVVIVSEWEDGDSWQDVSENWGESSRRKIADGLLQFFLEGLFQHGMMQADWHTGNVRFRQSGSHVQMVMYDLGCVYEPDEVRRLALARLIHATQTGKESPWPLLVKLGFNAEMLEPLASKLPAVCKVLFEPFCVDYRYPLEDWRLSERISDILGDDRWNFRFAGPPDLLYLMRAFHGAKYYLERANSPAAWSNAIQPHLASLRQEWDGLRLNSTAPRDCDFDQLSRYLKIRVSESGDTKVELSKRATCIERLDELLDVDLKRRIERGGHRLPDMVSSIRRRGYAPGPVFELNDGSKEIKVWLE